VLNITPSDRERNIVTQFHQLYYQHIGFVTPATTRRTYWMGTEVWKLPFDLWIYQELLHAIRPALIIETGTLAGGSALYLANICDLLGQGEIVTVDLYPQPNRPIHPRITYLHGSSIASEILAEMTTRAVAAAGPVLVILDSDHRRDHVLAEMRAYGKLVTPDSYMIVEDSNINGHPVLPSFGPGPMEAIQAFLQESNEFVVDYNCEKLFVTFNPSGYLHKRAAT
jgi:cephalosporin hydroxylase